jgi:hypothetical protein
MPSFLDSTTNFLSLSDDAFRAFVNSASVDDRLSLLTYRQELHRYQYIVDSGVSLNWLNRNGNHFLTSWVIELDSVDFDERSKLTRFWQEGNPLVAILQFGVTNGADPFLPDGRSGKSALEYAMWDSGGFEEPLKSLRLWNRPLPIDLAIFEMVNGYLEGHFDCLESALMKIGAMFAGGLNPNSVGCLRGSFMHFATAGYVRKFTLDATEPYWLTPYYESFVRLGLKYGGRLDLVVDKGGFSGLDKLRNAYSSHGWPKTVRRKTQSPRDYIAGLFRPGQFPGPFAQYV